MSVASQSSPTKPSAAPDFERVRRHLAQRGHPVKRIHRIEGDTRVAAETADGRAMTYAVARTQDRQLGAVTPIEGWPVD